MHKYRYWPFVLTVLFGLPLSLLPSGYSQQPAPVLTRDNYGAQPKALPRLSPEALERETAADAEGALKLEKAGRGSLRPQGTADAIPAHRLSSDILALGRLSSRSANEHQITLKNWFIETCKNRATITTPFRVVYAGRIHKAEDDGDQHVAGLADDVTLASVAEIMNAATEPAAVEAMTTAEETGDPLSLTGAWRLWCEHPGRHPHIQDDVIPEYPHSNPDHVFEIHPVSRVGSLKLLDSFRPIEGYEPKEAKRAFRYYESLTCRIVPDTAYQTTTIFTVKAVFNYVEFKLRIDDDQQFITMDGRIVRCSALTLDGEEIVQNRRMVFVKNTPPEKVVRSLAKGGEMHVLGIPRIDLALVSWRARQAQVRPEVLTWNLPYEIIVVGVYTD